MKTYSARPSHVKPRWHVFDANGKTLGRLATEIAVLLQGKHKPMYTRHILTGDFVIVINAGKIKVTGNKPQQKMYRRHSHYPGALRETPLSVLQERHPDRIIRAAVQGMLPKNIRGRQMLRRLKIYAGASHPHEAQVRQPVEREPAWATRERPPAPQSQVVVEQEAPEEQVVDETTTEAEVEEAASDEVEAVAETVEETEEAQEGQVEDSVEEQPAYAPAEETSQEKAGE